MYQALYRKWRPKTFDDVVGQNNITETLKHEISSGRLSHAYLFTGTRGTGKTTCAKILAKAVNCENPVDGNPCNCCPACVGIDDGTIMDVLEIDAASNNGVENIRSLREEANYTPASVNKRVYIIDEVHMLSNSAFNALLKIMEEPPEHLMFILATTEVHKVPNTILSRCQRFSFKRISPKDMSDRMRYICSQENIDITEEAIAKLARLADGSVRDALSLLDQCASTGGQVNNEKLENVLGLSGNDTTKKLFEYVLNKDTSSAISLLNDVYRDGKDISAVLSELSVICRDTLMCIVAERHSESLISGTYSIEELGSFAEKINSSTLIYILEQLQTTLSGLSNSQNQKTDAELCLISACDERMIQDMSAFASRLTKLEVKMSRTDFSSSLKQSSSESHVHDITQNDSDNISVSDSKTVVENSPDNHGSYSEKWPEILTILKNELDPPEFFNLQDDGSIRIEITDNTIHIDLGGNTIKNKLINTDKVKTAIKNASLHVMGKEMQVNIELRPTKKDDRFDQLLGMVNGHSNVKIK